MLPHQPFGHPPLAVLTGLPAVAMMQALHVLSAAFGHESLRPFAIRTGATWHMSSPPPLYSPVACALLRQGLPAAAGRHLSHLLFEGVHRVKAHTQIRRVCVFPVPRVDILILCHLDHELICMVWYLVSTCIALLDFLQPSAGTLAPLQSCFPPGSCSRHVMHLEGTCRGGHVRAATHSMG